MTTTRELEHATASLRALLDKAPKLSHAAAFARRQLDTLERPDCTFTTAEKLDIVRETARNFARARLVDNVLHSPGDRR